MRTKRALATKGTLNVRGRFSQETIVLVAMAVVALWLLWSLVQAITVDWWLNRQVAELQAQNASLQATNRAYREDIAAVSSGAAVEEDARLNGYARPGERLYLVGQPETPPRPAASGGSGEVEPTSPAQVLWSIVSAPFHR
ncbi:MAG TPA: septum formation initiator family protein [Candidatus Dormibacteraeota bacterium]|nr:septum formation initiator family protein [Candidatus Dormibacteraeota bacterium]